MPLIEEDLTLPEVRFAEGFLQWCHETGNGFGAGNIHERAAEYALQAGAKK